jgi:hypothetical protein
VIIGMDSPLGWPKELGSRPVSHRAGTVIEVDANLLFRRVTDGVIKQLLGKQSLDVGADRIARTAVDALRLLDQMRRDAGRSIPLTWAPDEAEPWRVIEVYPAATRRAHGALDAGGSLEGLDELVDCSAVLEIVRKSVDAADACVCALAAADFLFGRAVPPADLGTARKEGWIWAPEATSGSNSHATLHSRHHTGLARRDVRQAAMLAAQPKDGPVCFRWLSRVPKGAACRFAKAMPRVLPCVRWQELGRHRWPLEDPSQRRDALRGLLGLALRRSSGRLIESCGRTSAAAWAARQVSPFLRECPPAPLFCFGAHRRSLSATTGEQHREASR